MEKQKMDQLTAVLRDTCGLATGCTEPIAAAFAIARAAEELDGDQEIQEIHLTVDPGLYKNAMCVGIPGVEERGLVFACALGAVVRDSSKQLRLLEDLGEEQIHKAQRFAAEKKISITVKQEREKLYIEAAVKTASDTVHILVLDNHQNVVRLQKNGDWQVDAGDGKKEKGAHPLWTYGLAELIDYAKEVPMERIDFLKEGVLLDEQMAEEGLEKGHGFGPILNQMFADGTEQETMATRAQMLCASAAEARMSGVSKPVMASAGSGNHGLTVFLTSLGAAEVMHCGEETLIRSLALSNLITAYVKSYTGTLSAMCGCGVAAGVGASAGVAFMLGGNEAQIYRALVNMVGSIAGLLCDGGKEGCAYKVALSSGWAVQSAVMAVKGGTIDIGNGILAQDMKQLFCNLGKCADAMIPLNRTIIDILEEKQPGHAAE